MPKSALAIGRFRRHPVKKEFIHLHPFDTVERLRIGVFEYIEVYYNRLLIHSTIGYLTPVEFEEEFDKKGDRAA
ncbi:IS3 family transposase [Frankia sp. Cas3]|uniref:IS3 family transposase n=1 Tax=Frankia sp. Cas3 TaxID=3073926 RepID=UPI003A1035BD